MTDEQPCPIARAYALGRQHARAESERYDADDEEINQLIEMAQQAPEDEAPEAMHPARRAIRKAIKIGERRMAMHREHAKEFRTLKLFPRGD